MSRCTHRNDNKELLFLYVGKYQHIKADHDRRTYTFGFVTVDGEFYYDELDCCGYHKKFSPYTMHQLHKTVLRKFKITENTNVTLSKAIHKTDVVTQFFRLGHVFQDFCMSCVEPLNMYKRINYIGRYIKTTNFTSNMKNKLMDILFEKKKIPWYTEDVKILVENKSRVIAERMKEAIFGVYYICIKSKISEEVQASYFRRNKKKLENIVRRQRAKEAATPDTPELSTSPGI